MHRSALASAGSRLLQRSERFLGSHATRLLLSFLIILSVLPASALAPLLPESAQDAFDLGFLCIFTPEFALRLTLWLRRRERQRFASLLLLFDLLALVSFLPLRGVLPDHFRLLRLTRLLLLVGYWGGMLRDLWSILSGRERRFQIVFVSLLGLVLSFAGAVVLIELAPQYDYDGGGTIGEEDRAFPLVLWWSFRQVQDAGNLVTQPGDLLVVLVSLLLTFAGIVLLSFVIGISTGAMDELMRRQLDRPVGMRGHTVVLGVGPYTDLLLLGLARIYRKNGKRARVAVLGPSEAPPDCLYQPELLGFRYRQGLVDRADDLVRVDVESAKRVLVLGSGSEVPDARVISATLAARALTADALLFPDLEHEKNFLAARSAGGPRTRIVGSGSFLGYYVAQNVVFPGVYRAYRQLLDGEGCELYSYVFSTAERARLPMLDCDALVSHAWLVHGVTLVGLLVDAPGADANADPIVVLNPAWPAARAGAAHAFTTAGLVRPETLCGLVGICPRWRELEGLAQDLDAIVAAAAPAAVADGFGLLRLAPAAPRVERVLVCGSSLRVPRAVSELAHVYGSLEVTILVRAADSVAPLARDVRAALDGHLSSLPQGSERGWTVETGADRVSMRAHAARGEIQVRVIQADWSDATHLLRDPVAALAHTDVVLFLPAEAGDETDGLVALDCLRVAHFAANGALSLRPGFRVVGMLHDPVKSDLLERRLDAMAGPGAESRFTIISSERMRHHFLVRNLFVPGLSDVLLELLGAQGQHLCRLVPRDQALQAESGEFDAWELITGLRRRGLLTLGLELRAGSGATQVVMDPRRLGPGQRFAWREVTALYVLGDVLTTDPDARI